VSSLQLLGLDLNVRTVHTERLAQLNVGNQKREFTVKVEQ
jgi:hypothetical protein